MLSGRCWRSCAVLQPDGISDCYGIDCCCQMLRRCYLGKVFRSTVVPTAQVRHTVICPCSLHPSANVSFISLTAARKIDTKIVWWLKSMLSVRHQNVSRKTIKAVDLYPYIRLKCYDSVTFCVYWDQPAVHQNIQGNLLRLLKQYFIPLLMPNIFKALKAHKLYKCL